MGISGTHLVQSFSNNMSNGVHNMNIGGKFGGMDEFEAMEQTDNFPEEEAFRDFEDEMDNFEDDIDFADPGGNSALRAATKRNPRNQPCPTCLEENRLTLEDVALGYQCDTCADRDEMGGY